MQDMYVCWDGRKMYFLAFQIFPTIKISYFFVFLENENNFCENKVNVNVSSKFFMYGYKIKQLLDQ